MDAAFFPEEQARLEEAIASFSPAQPAHVAVVSEYLAGRTPFVQALIPQYGGRIAFMPLYSVAHDTGFLDELRRGPEIIVLGDCQNLFLRRIGGFENLDAFLEFAARTDRMLITTWNIHAWNYLVQARSIGACFPVQIALPRISAGAIKTAILSGYTREIRFVEDTPSKTPVLLSLGKKSSRSPSAAAKPLFPGLISTSPPCGPAYLARRRKRWRWRTWSSSDLPGSAAETSEDFYQPLHFSKGRSSPPLHR